MSPARTIVLAALAACSAASPILAQRQSQGYTLAATGSGAPVNANGGAFYTNKPTNAGCAIDSCQSFPNTTTIDIFDTGAAGMFANVPGGQNIYIAPSGALSFTLPHEESVYPKDSITTGFYQVHDGYQFLFAFDGVANKGWAECGDYGQIYALVDNNTCDNPQPLTISSTATTQAGAFQYD